MIADRPTQDYPVLLLDVAAGVGVAWPSAGDGDLMFLTPSDQEMIDDLAAVVGIDAQDREGHGCGDLLERGEHPFTDLVGHAAIFDQLGGDISHREGETVLTGGVAALIAE